MKIWACILMSVAISACRSEEHAGDARAEPVDADRSIAVLVGGGAGKGEVADFLQPKAWQDGRLPQTGEDVRIRCSAKMAKKAKFTREMGSLSVEAPATLQIGSRLMMRGDVRIGGRLEINNGSLVIGGRLALAAGEGGAALSVALADDNPFPLLNCAGMELEDHARIEMIWWYSPPPEAPGNSMPMLRIRDQLHLGKGAQLALSLNGFAAGYHLPAGDYLLMGADRLSGDLPKLTINGWSEGSAPLPILALADDGRGVILRVRQANEHH